MEITETAYDTTASIKTTCIVILEVSFLIYTLTKPLPPLPENKPPDIPAPPDDMEPLNPDGTPPWVPYEPKPCPKKDFADLLGEILDWIKDLPICGG